MSLPKLIHLFARTSRSTVQGSILLKLINVTPKNFYSSIYNNLDKTCQYSSRFTLVQNNLISKRFKRNKGKRNKNDDEDLDEEEDDDDDEDGENPLLMDTLTGSNNDGSVTELIDINSLRLDAFLRGALKIPRNKIEESFYKGDIYINGEKAVKKSQDLSLGDEIDMVKGINAEDPTMIDIRRVQILKLPDKLSQQGRLKVEIKRWGDLTIDSIKPDD